MGARAFTVRMGPAVGPMVFRAPFYALIGKLNEFLALHTYEEAKDGQDIGTEGEPQRIPADAWLRGHLPYAGAAIGVAWAHDLKELSTPALPGTSVPTDAELYEYGTAVADELQTEGWPMLAIISLGTAVVTEIRNRYRAANEAAKLADFLPAQADTSIGTS